MTIWDDTADSTKELMFTALDYALENAQLSDQPFTPFSFARQADGTATLTRFAVAPGADVPETLEAAREHLASAEPGITAIALAYDGYTTYEGDRTEAVFVETHQLDLPRTLVLAQRYLRKDGEVHPLGNPMLQAEIEPLVLDLREA
ncbi:hypothetical protein KGQ20_19155 [Catenulispora sp. NF23]|uniref:hypothetical protein n=1 Tax=Catenulispora pinistramenti TaxID=2705254 RepID=UPI001BA83420|nr:hypothetical protein [Catenulispora pinistramenti]MBS2534892.1 hypothetical protein [Catenulispora pinistramenti]